MGYRSNILGNINRSHPHHKGVKMQAHHLISKRAVKLSGLKADLEHLGYDINVKENLVLFPSTLKGACYLKVQLHRGDHKAKVDDSFQDSADDRDGAHPPGYHVAVMGMLVNTVRRRNNGRLCGERETEIQDDLNDLSENVLVLIKTYILNLTSIAKSFAPLPGNSGCCDEVSTTPAREKIEAAEKGGPKPTCSKSRNHHGDEGIKYVMTLPYLLEVGK